VSEDKVYLNLGYITGRGEACVIFCEQMYYFSALTPFDSVCIMQNWRSLKEKQQSREVMSVFRVTSWTVMMNHWQIG
jgi:hypothetical protein